MEEQEFLEMCRLAGADDSGGQWTDEKIEAIEAVKADARGVVWRLLRMYRTEQQRAEQAEFTVSIRDEQLQVSRDVEKYLRTVIDELETLYSKAGTRLNELHSQVQHMNVYASYCYGCGIRGEKTTQSFDTWVQAMNKGTHTAKENEQ